MRSIALLLCLSLSTAASPDTVQKWVDSEGMVHYGDTPPKETPRQLELMNIQNNFDVREFESAIKRNSELEKEIRKIAQREQKHTISAEKRLEKYLDYLDKEDARLEKERNIKRKLRESRRNATSIKIKRAKQNGNSNKPSSAR